MGGAARGVHPELVHIFVWHRSKKCVTLARVTLTQAETEKDEKLPSPPTARVVRILELFARRPIEPIGLAEVARVLDLSKPTVHAILNTLVELGWLSRDDTTKSYALGAGLLVVGRAAEAGYPLVTLAAAQLEQLSARHGMTVTVGALLGDEIQVLDAAIPPARADGTVYRGMGVPFAPPFGAVFAAWGPVSRTRSWLDRAPAATVAAQHAALDAVRIRGFAIDLLTDTSRRIRTVLARLAGWEGSRDVQMALLPLMAELSDAGHGEELPSSGAFDVDVMTVPILDRFGHAALGISAQVNGPLTKAGVEDLAADLREAAGRVSASLPGVSG
jgi:DNA-binding IclR family transcriptional regulator